MSKSHVRVKVRPRTITRSGPSFSPSVPLRTIARSRVLDLAAQLDVTLSKSQLRAAIDRMVRALRRTPVNEPMPPSGASASTGSAPIADQTAAYRARAIASGLVPASASTDEQPFAALRSAISDQIVAAGQAAECAESKYVFDADRSAQYSIAPFRPLGALSGLAYPVSVGSASPPASPVHSAITAADQRLDTLVQVIQRISLRLEPILSPAPPSTSGSNQVECAGPSPFHVVSAIERFASRVQMAVVALDSLLDRLVI